MSQKGAGPERLGIASANPFKLHWENENVSASMSPLFLYRVSFCHVAPLYSSKAPSVLSVFSQVVE